MKLQKFKTFESLETEEITGSVLLTAADTKPPYKSLESLTLTEELAKILQSEIARFVKIHYAKYGWNFKENKDIHIDGFGILDSRYISLFINNRTVWSNIYAKFRLMELQESRKVTPESLVDHIVDNIYEYFYFTGKHFMEVLRVVMNCVRRGNKGEELTIQEFKKMSESRGCFGRFLKPTTPQDIKGIDSIFEFNSKTYNIQIKPFESYSFMDENVKIESKGCFDIEKEEKIDYVCFYNLQNREFLLLNNKGGEVKATTTGFIAPKSKIIKY